MVKVPPPILEDLAYQIANSESTKDLRDSIEILMRQRYGVTSQTIDPVNAVLRFFCESDSLLDAVTYLVESRRTLAFLANDLVQDLDYDYCELDASHNKAAEKVFEALEIPVVRWHPEYDGVTRIDSRLADTARELRRLRHFNDSGKLKNYGTVAWSYLETLLEVSIRFYAALFGYGNRSQVTRAFAHALRQDSLNPMLDAIRKIEKSFSSTAETSTSAEQGQADTGSHNASEEDDDERGYAGNEREVCNWFLGRNSPFEHFLDGGTEIIPSTMPPGWVDIAKAIDEKFPRDNHPGIIQMLRLNKYKTDISYFRNFYAHANPEAIVNAGIERARDSFNSAYAIIDRLHTELDLCPILILPIEDGYDAYGRRVVRFVEEHSIGDDGTFSVEKSGHFFPRRDAKIELYFFYFCSSPKSSMFEPFIWPTDEIIKELS